jgi:hypothetical protein
MSLRADIRTAYDEITPPAPALEAQIRTLVTAESTAARNSRPGRRPWITGLRGGLALVAALLVVLIVATVLIGGRVWHDWTIFNTRPAPAGQTDKAALAALEARQVQLPVVAADAACPAGPSNTIDDGSGPSSRLGNGPVYGDAMNGVETAWGWYFGVTYWTNPELRGLVLIRGRDLRNGTPVVFLGEYGAGQVTGTDTLDGKTVVQHSELVFNASNHPATSGTSKWGIYRLRQGIARDWTMCTGFQIDGDGFSEVLVG